MTVGDNDDRHAQEGYDAMGTDETTLDCDWCVFDPSAAGQPARFGITVSDCCNDRTSDHLVCGQHWALVRDQYFPAACPLCGDVADSLDAIVTHVIPLGTYDESELHPSPNRADTSAIAAMQILPTAIRTPVSGPAPSNDDIAAPAASDDGGLSAAFDYEASAERDWITHREALIATEDDQRYRQPIAQLQAQLNTTADPAGVSQIATQIHLIDQKREAAAHHARDALARDRHAYALWRQTDDGRYFIDWLRRTLTVTEWAFEVHETWMSGWRAMRASIPEAEVRAHAAGVWVPRPLRQVWARYVLYAGAAVILIGIIAGLVHPLMFVVAGAGVAILVGGLVLRRDGGWAAANTAAAERAHRHRVGRFGFDPLDEPSRRAPSWTAHADPSGYLGHLLDLTRSGFENHPRPADLPEPYYLPLADSSVVPAELDGILTAAEAKTQAV